MTIIALFTLAAWACLGLFRGGFWRADQRLGNAPAPNLARWPSVVAVIPARDEAATIGDVVAAHLAADYPGDFSVMMIDDRSSDGTAEIATAAADGSDRLTVIKGTPLSAGWTGKLWAVHQGVTAVQAKQAPDYFLLTDADIILASDTLSRLIAKAETESLSLVSLMARLDARGFWGGLLMPAFVFFFQKLYPFPTANDANENLAAAAGGCMLIRSREFNDAGGVAAIRDQLIDDCALAHAVKDLSPATRIWIGLADDEATSLRDNRSLSSIWTMVARTAYAQLGYSLFMLVLAIVGMAFIYLAPPLIALGLFVHHDLFAAGLGLSAWGVMARLYNPTLKLYGGEPWQAATLPIAATVYMAMTIHSAMRHWKGRGGQWKGRHYDLSKTS